jgi:hypothetical protein
VSSVRASAPVFVGGDGRKVNPHFAVLDRNHYEAIQIGGWGQLRGAAVVGGGSFGAGRASAASRSTRKPKLIGPRASAPAELRFSGSITGAAGPRAFTWFLRRCPAAPRNGFHQAFVPFDSRQAALVKAGGLVAKP